MVLEMARFQSSRWILLLAACVTMTQLPQDTGAAFVPNNYYRMIVAALARRQKLSDDATKYPRTLYSSVDEMDARDVEAGQTLGTPEVDPFDNWSSAFPKDYREKRLMGLFRCSGWGPSCTGGGGSGFGSAGYSTGFNLPTEKLQQQQQQQQQQQPSRRRKHQRSYDQLQKKPPQPITPTAAATGTERTTTTMNGGHNRVGNGRRQAAKFEPFFALTSGGSWGPAGRRRRFARSTFSLQ